MRLRLSPVGAIMDCVRAALIAAVAAIAPLRGLNDVAALLLAAASVAVGTPQRALRVARLVGGALVEQVPLLDELLCSLTTMPGICDLLAMLPARDNTTFVTGRTACVVCDGTLIMEDRSITLPRWLLLARVHCADSRRCTARWVLGLGEAWKVACMSAIA